MTIYINKYNQSWFNRSRCIVCKELIFHARNTQYNFSRIAHISCVRKVIRHPEIKIMILTKMEMNKR